MEGRVGAAAALVLVCVPLMPGVAQVSRQQGVRAGAIVTGAAVGLGVAVLQAVLQFGYESEFTPLEHVVTYTPTAMTAMAASVFCTLALSELYQSVPMHPLLGVLTGAAGGFVEGALIGGATYAVFFGLASAVNPGFTKYPSWWRATAQGAMGGAIFGGLIGLAPGALAGLTVTLVLRR